MHNVGIVSAMRYHPIGKNVVFHKARDEERKLKGRGVERRGEEAGEESRKGEGGGERSEEKRKRIYPGSD